MKTLHSQAFEIAYVCAIAASLPYFLFLLMSPAWATIPAVLMVVSAVVMFREYRRVAIADKAADARIGGHSHE